MVYNENKIIPSLGKEFILKHTSWIGFVLLFVCAVISLFGCQKREENTSELVIAPSTPTPSTNKENQTVHPSPKTIQPSASATVSSTPAQPLQISSFFSDENAYLSGVFLGAKKSTTYASYLEYITEDDDVITLQRRTFFSDDTLPTVEITQFDGTSIRRIGTLQNIDYTYNYLSTKNEDEILLQEPIALHASWAVTDGESTITSTNVQLTIPFGKINAIEVTTMYDNGEKRLQYFAQGIGLVAEYQSDENNTLLHGTELSERELDRTYSQSIRFYYPDHASFQDDSESIKYIDQTIGFTPNMNIRRMFAERLSTPLSDSTLIPLSSTVQIRSIELINDEVHVDFSSELVTQMDLPRQGEKLLLQALADTFGAYYHKDKVFFTVEEEGYASRYFFFLDDEYWTPNTRQTVAYQ